LDSLGRARLERVSGGNHLHRDRLGRRRIDRLFFSGRD
jgi:hypothetical protein